MPRAYLGFAVDLLGTQAALSSCPATDFKIPVRQGSRSVGQSGSQQMPECIGVSMQGHKPPTGKEVLFPPHFCVWGCVPAPQKAGIWPPSAS